MSSRREVLKSMALGVGLAVPAGIAAQRVGAVVKAENQADNAKTLAVAQAETPAPWGLFQPLNRGDEIAHGWSIAGLTGAIAGAFNLRLSNADGRAATVHVCLKDEYSSGIAQSEQLDLVLMNGGESDRASEEDLAQVLGTIANVVRENEVFLGSDVVGALLSHEDRVRKFANVPEFQGVLV